MRNICFLLLMAIVSVLCSCQKYLDIVPDNVATINDAFANKNEAEKYLFNCYSFIPQAGHPETNPAFNAGDEFWIYWPIDKEDYWRLDPYNIARGLQNKVEPDMDYWDGYDRPSLWQGIRDCNIFLSHIDEVKDLDPFERKRWVAEVKFIKAYLHWYLFRMYGPIPIMDKNLPVTATPGQVHKMRQPVDSVVNYIAALYDSAAAPHSGLPDKIANKTTELGRITRPAVLALKARLLVTAASPLFNGNQDYAGFKNKAGETMFNSSFEKSKWVMAANACKEAIDACHAAGITLYQFNTEDNSVDSATAIEMTIRNAVCKKWNSGEIWASTIKADATNTLQEYACPQLDADNINLGLKGQLAPTLRMAELFYSKHGVPIEEDKKYAYKDRFNLKVTTADDSLMQLGYETLSLYFNRGPRFYADMGFDGAKWFMQNGTYDIQTKSGQLQGKKQGRLFSVTGYFCKKLVNWKLVVNSGRITLETYPWPVMRLADLYLLYAESLNEIQRGNEAITWLDKVRARVGLKGIKESWDRYAKDPNEYRSQGGLRKIIHQERLIEMAFEGSRFWDLRRWKEAADKLNKPVYGWDITKSSAEDYYQKILLFNQEFISPRDYFWPIKESNLTTNSNLTQNPGW